jgi:hypothetical protein
MLDWSAAKLALVMMTPPDDEKPSPRRAVQLESGQRGSKITHTHTKQIKLSNTHARSRSSWKLDRCSKLNLYLSLLIYFI